MGEVIPVSNVTRALTSLQQPSQSPLLKTVPVVGSDESHSGMDQALKILDGLSNILDKGLKIFETVNTKIIQKPEQNIPSRNQSGNTVLAEKIIQRETGKTEIVRHAENVPEKPKEIKQEVIQMQEQNIQVMISQIEVGKVVKKLEEKIPSEFKEKTVGELLKTYSELGELKKIAVDTMIKYSIIKGLEDEQTPN